MKRLTQDEYIAMLRKVQGNLFTPIEDYKNKHAKIMHRCNKCEHEFLASPINLLSSNAAKRTGCEKCRDKTPGNKLTHKEFIKRLVLKHGNAIKCLDKYYSVGERLRFKCTACSNIWTTIARGVLHGTGCPECAERGAHGGRSPKRPFKLGNRTVMVQGYEPQALRYIISKGVNPNKISISMAEGKPSVPYRFEGKDKLYYPDFFYKPNNRIIEVKSVWTLTNQYKRNVAKAKSCIELGYDFMLILMDANGKRIKTPKNWYDLPKKRLLKFLG